MSDERFPLTKQLGLKTKQAYWPPSAVGSCGSATVDINWSDVVLASDLERILEQAPVVYGTNGRGKEIDYRANVWAPDAERFNSCDHHRGRIICIEPVPLEPAEKLLRDIAKATVGSAEWLTLRDRMKRLLGSGCL